ncbi:RHS repeat domain-containing protein, partial [Prevotella sp. HMSC073D09]|uniref:RHS repeat domain-containing protein n=1 Tax=Prevotella sp. HMSC073D09 TaxID=1739459 RepID=UPI000AED537A
KFNKKGDVPGPPIQWQKPEDPDNAQPGYGYVPSDTTNTEEIFFYHSDHLGSTSYITDAKANITQFDAYLPYGELLVDEHSSSEEMLYKFNGKELDEETGLYYYGARYMNPVTSLWYGVDPLAEKYHNVGGYVYCAENPIKYLDTDGRRIVIHYQDKNGNQKTYIFTGYRGKKVFTSLMFSSSRILLQHITTMLIMVGEKILYLRQPVISMRYEVI